jgi:hypothetical protein
VASLPCSTCHADHKGRDFAMVALDSETFDHALTDFTLVGAHVSVPCESCHVADKTFAQAPSACIRCHEKIEPHKGALGKDCARCHTESRWTEAKAFDHSRTKFALAGAHEKLECAACHAGEVWTGLPLECVGCHKIDDVHENRFGAVCTTCHTSAKWTEVKFDHDRDTKYDLTGKHRDTKCNACHLPGTDPKKTPQDCIGCHKADDVHAASLGTDCASCHGTKGWAQEVVFDHDLTRMPLIGMHAVVPCEGCHASKAFGATEIACASCHTPDDVHKASLGTDCATCHNPNGWAFWRFDHDSQTDFDLTGAHKGMACEGCHAANTDPAKQPVICASCHKKQDVHKGRYGADCGACHMTSTFKGAKLKLPKAP